MEKQVKIGEKEYTIKKIKYLQAVELEGLERVDMARKMLKYSAELTDEEIDNLELQEGIELQTEVNKLNNLNQSDFQKPTG